MRMLPSCPGPPLSRTCTPGAVRTTSATDTCCRATHVRLLERRHGFRRFAQRLRNSCRSHDDSFVDAFEIECERQREASVA